MEKNEYLTTCLKTATSDFISSWDLGNFRLSFVICHLSKNFCLQRFATGQAKFTYFEELTSEKWPTTKVLRFNQSDCSADILLTKNIDYLYVHQCRMQAVHRQYHLQCTFHKALIFGATTNPRIVPCFLVLPLPLVLHLHHLHIIFRSVDS